MNREDNPSGIFWKHTIIPSLSLTRLKEEKNFKAAVLQEMEVLGDLIDIKPLIREYIDSLGRVHIFLRETLQKDVAKWDSSVLEIQNRFREAIEDDIKTLSIEARDSTGKLIDSEHILSEIIEHRNWLVRKNQIITSFSSNIITNKVHSR